MSVPEMINLAPSADQGAGLNRDQKIQNGEIGGAIELWSNPEGLAPQDIVFTLDRTNPITGDPQQDTWITDETLRQSYAAAAARTDELRGPNTQFQDTNDPKVTIHEISQEGPKLQIIGRLSRYYVLWGLPGVAEELWKKGINELRENKRTEVPLGNSTHNILLVRNSITNETMMVIMAVTGLHGFAAGKLTITCEHQQHPDRHSRPVDAVVDGFKREFGIEIPEERVRLHKIAAETRSAYVSTIHIADMTDTLTEEDVIRQWGNKVDWRQGSSLLFVPVSQLAEWKSEDIPYDIWSRKEIIRHSFPRTLMDQQDYKLHHTGPLRVLAVQEYLNSKKMDTLQLATGE